jgi:hypothetical protein
VLVDAKPQAEAQRKTLKGEAEAHVKTIHRSFAS